MRSRHASIVGHCNCRARDRDRCLQLLRRRYDATYTNNGGADPLGYLDSGYSIGDDGTIAPWMDDFFTWSIGSLVDMGFDGAKPLRDWKAKYQIGRMMDPGYCWIFASVYHMSIEDPATSTFYTAFADVYAATLNAEGDPAGIAAMPCGGPEMAAALGLQPGEMVGYSSGAEGYPSNFQPALAVAAASSAPNAKQAFEKFMARSVKPDYSSEPQFAIVPR